MGRRPTGKPTSFDIAYKAGVSQPTVSRALRGDRSVSKATRERIEQIARELNYTVDRNASSLRSQRSNTIALLFFEDPTPDDSMINPFFLAMLGSITRACANHGLDLLISYQRMEDDWHTRYQDSMRADGLILLGYGDWEIYQALGRRLRKRLRRDAGKPLMVRVRDAVMQRMAPHRLLDLALRNGRYGKRSGLRLSLATLKAAPHGVDLGPLRSTLPKRLFTRDKRITCLNADLRAALARYDEVLSVQMPEGDDALWLIGRRHVRSNNSWMHNSRRLVKGKPRHQLFMHPDDLAARGLRGGDQVRVCSRVGAVEVEVMATDAIMRGVVSLPHGWGHARPGVALRVAGALQGQSANDLTDDQHLDTLSGNAALNGVPVTVRAVTAEAAARSFGRRRRESFDRQDVVVTRVA